MAYPDAEAVVTTYLRDYAGIEAPIYGALPPDPDYPCVVVVRYGGIPRVRRYLDRASIQVDVWGGTKEEAYDLTATVHAALYDLEGEAITEYGAFVTAVDDDLGTTWLPDIVTGRSRYLFRVGVCLHAYEEGDSS